MIIHSMNSPRAVVSSRKLNGCVTFSGLVFVCIVVAFRMTQQLFPIPFTRILSASSHVRLNILFTQCTIFEWKVIIKVEPLEVFFEALIQCHLMSFQHNT